VQLIANCFDDSSDLLKHELAYCLGQMGRPEAIPILANLLKDKKTAVIVRHEAGEALGAIGGDECAKIVSKYVEDEAPEVAETCFLASVRSKLGKACDKNTPDEFVGTVDPALPLEGVTDVTELGKIARNPYEGSYGRYAALFKLRNINTTESAMELGNCLNCMNISALQRHEVAFILGQIRQECTIEALTTRLADLAESSMVRHECAEALGSIGTEECMNLLEKYLSDQERIVRESCEVALDMCEYATTDEFEYANGLSISSS